MTHEHNWRVAFTQTEHGSIIKSHLRCMNPGCDHVCEDGWSGKGWKIVEGSFGHVEVPMVVINS